MSTTDPLDREPTRGEGQGDTAPSWSSKVFELDRKGFNLARGLVILAVLLVPLVVLGLIDKEEYWLSVAFGALLVGLASSTASRSRTREISSGSWSETSSAEPSQRSCGGTASSARSSCTPSS